ncbi:hypothetical protein E1K68_06865 [Pseudomonas sp. B2021]|nr:hypothetical protein [Pseudomonas sp. B2021]
MRRLFLCFYLAENRQNNTGALSALLRTANRSDILETNSLCCAAGIITPPSATMYSPEIGLHLFQA